MSKKPTKKQIEYLALHVGINKLLDDPDFFRDLELEAVDALMEYYQDYLEDLDDDSVAEWAEKYGKVVADAVDGAIHRAISSRVAQIK